MKRIVKLFQHIDIFLINLFLTIPLITSASGISALEKSSVSGKLTDQINNQAVAYASVALYNIPDSVLVNGTVSDDKGWFVISQVSHGRYRLSINALGYKTLIKEVDVKDGKCDLEVLYLEENAINLNEAVVVADRPKAKTEQDKTIYFINQKMIDASYNGADILKLIPGIQIDLMRNISLEGSRSILILVDGKERDINFVSQINPVRIDKVEIISSPPSKYDASITGVINIILKKENASGISGQVYAEVPTSSTVYIFPFYNFSYGIKKLNLYTSYNGEITHFDNVSESTYRKYNTPAGTAEIISSQKVVRNTWLHWFHSGLDYVFNSINQLNFYAFYNPYSREYDGQAAAQSSGITNRRWSAGKEDTDKNYSTYASLWYKHNFGENDHEITFDLINYHLKGNNATTYTSQELNNGGGTITNNVKPIENTSILKIDYNTSTNKKIRFGAGVRATVQFLKDASSNNFKYSEKIFSGYSSMGYKHAKYDFNLGLRIENSLLNMESAFSNNTLALLPHAALNLKLSSNQNIQLSLSRFLNRPGINQLDPFTYLDDPFTVRKGNAFLNPEFRNAVFIEHSVRFNSNFISTRLFYSRTKDAINDLTFINDTSAFERRFYNLGIIHQYGVQWTGSLKLFKIITLNPYLKLFSIYTSGNDLARQYLVPDRHQIALESGLSTILSFKHDLSFSSIFQYSSPKNNIQGSSFSDVLYFFSVEKTFKKKFKAGVAWAIPFTKSFTYQGNNISGPAFYSHYEGDIKLSKQLIWFKLSYQFTSGQKHEKINRSHEEVENMPKKGF